ncbi:MAG: hydrogenase nickel incorporation protein HypB [Deltaproteobacteria bacterium]|nr:hydrogenase nickel incorporation protein HypB [Deltaproteobacteria bacterium]
MKISVVRNILEANDRIAQQNRDLFTENGLLVINLMSSPGAGKTSLLEKTIDALKDDVGIGIIEGDIQSTQDAERIARKGVPAVMDLLIVENVGNLVCPAEFKVGEDFKAMILSVTEGDDKPSKYPLMFRESKVLLINKIDLLPYVDCSLDRIKEDSLKINPDLSIFEISCKTGEGLEEWYEWLRERIKNREVIS